MSRALHWQLAIALGVVGCDSPVVLSTLVETDEIFASYEVSGSDTGLRAEARFYWTNAKQRIVLSDGDRVEIDGVVLTDTESDSTEQYAIDVDPLGEHTFALLRGDARRIEHRIATPTPLQITSMAFDGTYETLQATLVWSPRLAGAEVYISVTSEDPGCTDVVLSSQAPDLGSFTFTGADVKPLSNPNTMTIPACTFELLVRRVERPDAALSGLGRIDLLSKYVDSTTLTIR